jgi:transcriptional regulator with XRE-family HTH domain
MRGYTDQVGAVGCSSQPIRGKFPAMEIRRPDLTRFRERIVLQRTQREWSQMEVARRLTAMGIDNMHNTTIAKIEAGDREIKLDEAVALAELYGLSIESLIGRRPGSADDIQYALVALEDAVFTSRNELNRTSKSLWNRLNDVPSDFPGYDTTAELVGEYSRHLNSALEVLNELVNRLTDEAMQRAQERAIYRLMRGELPQKGPQA